MSIYKKILALGLVSILAIGSVSTFAAVQNINPKVKEALLTGNFSQFKEARKAQVDQMTESEFKTRSDRFKSMDAVQTAIEKCDFAAFQTATANKPGKKAITEAEFKVMCERNKDMEARWVKVQDTIKSGDFNAYKTAINDLHPNMKNKPQQDESKMQERFNILVAEFKATGQLPEFEMRNMGRFHNKGNEMKGNRGGEMGQK
jgi:hypothetical protein